MTLRFAAVFLALVPPLAACASSNPNSQDVATQCGAVLHSACTRAIVDCKLSSPWEATVDQCVSDNMTACCNGACDRQASSSEESIQACQRALQAASCDSLVTVQLPAECQHVVY